MYFESYKDGNKKTISIMTTNWPELKPDLIDNSLEDEMKFFQAIVTSIRGIRSKYNISHSIKLDVSINSEKMKEDYIFYINNLCNASVVYSSSMQNPENCAVISIPGAIIYVNLENIVDLSKEKEKIMAEIQRLENFLVQIDKKLENRGFMSNALPEIVEKERQKREDTIDLITKLKGEINGWR